jgi:hypothetical protein
MIGPLISNAALDRISVPRFVKNACYADAPFRSGTVVAWALAPSCRPSADSIVASLAGLPGDSRYVRGPTQDAFLLPGIGDRGAACVRSGTATAPSETTTRVLERSMTRTGCNAMTAFWGARRSVSRCFTSVADSLVCGCAAHGTVAAGSRTLRINAVKGELVNDFV